MERACFLGERLQVLEAGPIAGDADDVSQDADAASLRGDETVRASEPYKPVSDTLAPGWWRWWRRITGGG